MIKYTYLNPISEKGLTRFTDKYHYTEDVDEAQCILVRSKDMKAMDVPKNVVAVARAGAGTNNIPVEDYAEKGIFVFNTPGANATSVKESVFAGMYLAARDIMGGCQWCVDNASDPDIAKNAEKAKKAFAGGELAGKKLGVIGLGAIGAKVANEAINKEMDVYGFDPYLSINSAWSLSSRVHHVENINDILSVCDYITIHVPLLPSTKNMIDKACVDKIKKGAVLVNFSRDAIVDEKAVIEALEEGRLRKYVSDFPNPTVAGHKDVILTPHLGASTEEAEENCAIMAVKQIMNFMETGSVTNCVNLPNMDVGPVQSEMRLCIVHKNKQGMIAGFTKVLDEANINVGDLSNKSRDDIAYTVIDLDKKADQSVVDSIFNMTDVISARVI